MTWALVPDQPNPLTPAMGMRSAEPGQGVGSDVTRSGTASQSISGEGFSKCRCLGITPCFMASITLTNPATPAAGSRWPTFVFTDPMSSGWSASRSWQ